MGIGTILEDIGNNILAGLTDMVPRSLTAIVVVLVGWIVAKVVQRVLRSTLTRVKFDSLLDRMGLAESLQSIGLREPASQWVPKVLYYFILIYIIRIACLAAGLTEIAGTINTLLAFLPKIVAALVIVMVGSTVGRFAGNAVAGAAENSGIDYASVLGRLVSSLVIFVVVIMAVAQLGLNMDIVNSVILIGFAGFALCFAISLGLGTREITRNIVAGFYARKAFSVGDDVVINGQGGIIKSFSPVLTMVERDGKLVAVPNSVFLSASSN